MSITLVLTERKPWLRVLQFRESIQAYWHAIARCTRCEKGLRFTLRPTSASGQHFRKQDWRLFHAWLHGLGKVLRHLLHHILNRHISTGKVPSRWAILLAAVLAIDHFINRYFGAQRGRVHGAGQYQ